MRYNLKTTRLEDLNFKYLVDACSLLDAFQLLFIRSTVQVGFHVNATHRTYALYYNRSYIVYLVPFERSLMFSYGDFVFI